MCSDHACRNQVAATILRYILDISTVIKIHRDTCILIECNCLNHFVPFTQNPFCRYPCVFVIPGEETTRTGVKYTGYTQTLVPQDDGKPASYFKIVLSYNGLDNFIPCLPESQEELEHALQGIMTCFKDAKHYINVSLSVLPPESEGTDIMICIKKSVTKMAADLQHYENGTGKKKVRKLGPGEKSSESKKSKPGESSGETGHARPRPHQRRPGMNVLCGDTKLPPDMCHCGLLCPKLSYLAIHIQNAHSDGLYPCIHCGTQLSTKRIAWKHVTTVHLKRFHHHCMYMDAKDPTKECSYGCDELDIIQTHMRNNHSYFSPLVFNKCGRQLSSKNALERHKLVCKKTIGERKSMCVQQMVAVGATQQLPN